MKRAIISILMFFLLSNFSFVIENAEAGLGNKFESKHFIFYFAEEQEKLKDIFSILERNYDNITNRFQVKFVGKIEVEIYPTLNDYHMEVYGHKVEGWKVGNYDVNDKKLRMVSPNNPGTQHDYNSIVSVAVHEFVHYVVHNVIDDGEDNLYGLPTWLSEGVAVYYAGQMNEYIRNQIKEWVIDKKIPSIYDLEKGNFAGMHGYQISFTIVEFIIKKYGEKKLIEFIRAPEQYQEVFSMTKEEFNQKWQGYLTKEFK